MAKVLFNVFLKGLSGTVSDMTFRQRGGATIVSRKRRAGNAEPTEMQLDNQRKFNEATMYAKTVIKDPAIKAIYNAAATGGQSAYNVAFSDAFKGPEIKSISASEYHGQPGDIIYIQADKILILKMDVVIVNADGIVLEEGQAVFAGKKWKYTARVQNEALRGSTIIVTVVNRPGKMARTEMVIER